MALSHSQVLGASGRPVVGLGADLAWKQFIKGDIVVSLQWIDLTALGSTEGGVQPCMALYAANRRVDAGAFVIPQTQAFMYVDNRGNPTRHLLAGALKASMQLGFFSDRATAYRVVDAITEALPDLLRMPTTAPEAAEAKKPIMGIELSASINGREFARQVV